MTGFCATAPDSVPRLTLPDIAREPCTVWTLPETPTQADLDNGYDIRGQQTALCDGKRALAVEAFDAQQRALQPLPRPWWARLLGD